MPEAELHSAPPPIPDFEMVRRIGRGSYGEVWLARSVTGAFRAVKIVDRDRFDSARPYDREFEGIQKYEPVSRSTEGLVHLLHVSRGDGFFYYVMELADDVGQLPPPKAIQTHDPETPRRTRPAPLDPERYVPLTLAALVKEPGRLGFAECVRIALALTKGLEHLHANGLVHRDIKPSNIIFVNGLPRLADIGLVTDAGAPRTLVGTEGYLPPDGGGTPGADLYSLGKVLYEISTGQDRREFPAMPLNFAELPDRSQLLELSEVFERACEALPADRYGTAVEMRADLELLLAGQSVVQRRRKGWRLRQLGRVALLAVLASALVAAGWLWRQQTRVKPITPATDPAASAKAASAYRQGRAAIDRRTRREFTNALAHFDEALRVDPGFALAQAGRAEALAFLASYDPTRMSGLWQQARSAAETALRQVPELASGQLALGLIELNHDWDWAGAEKHFRAGLRGEPGSAEGHQRLASVLGVLGRTEEAVAEARRAVELEPASRGANYSLGLQLYHARRYEGALAHLRRTLILTPDFATARLLLTRVLLQMERGNEGLDERIDLIAIGNRTNLIVRELVAARAQLGAAGFWSKRLEQLSRSGPSYELLRAEAYVRLGEFPAAITALENAARQRDPSAIYLNVDPLHDPLRGEPRFRELCFRHGFAAPFTVAELSADLDALLSETDRAAGISAGEKGGGFRPLFDGRTLSGWRADGGNWKVVNGALQADPGSPEKPKPGSLRYLAEPVPDDFELRFEWRVAPGGNSGVNYRPGLVEYQVVDNALKQVAASPETSAGSLAGCLGPTDDQTRPVGEWNEGRIVCRGSTIEHWLNGLRLFRFDYNSPAAAEIMARLDALEAQRNESHVRARGGYLSLPDQAGGAAFRRLRWRRLD